MASCAPAALHAETSNAELAKEIDELKAQIRELKGAVSATRSETRKTNAKVNAVAAKGYAVPPPGPPIPYGAVPAFVTADKKLQFGAITITPGGFLAMESAFRTRTEQADIGSNYGGIPFGPLAGTNEFRFSARQSRIAALVEAPITPTFLASGYGEFDFLGSGATSNENESDSFVPRIRHLYGTLDMKDYGFHVLAGQTWSLVTMNSKGITPRNEVTPPTIDAQYVPGFTWKRQPQIRVTKDFDQKLWFSLAAEEPQDTINGCTAGVNQTAVPGAAGTVGSTTVTCDTNGTNNLNGTVSSNNGAAGGQAITPFSLNHVPDVTAKAAYEAKLGDHDVHLEAFGIYRDLYDRVASTTTGVASDKDTTGYGVGGGLVAAVIPKKLDFQASGMWGRGIGSYGTSQFSDATFNSDGSLAALPEFMALAGLTLHATPAIDLYLFGGLEQADRDFYATNTASLFGYGATNANNSGCFNSGLGVTAAGGNSFNGITCGGNQKRVWQVTAGMWDKVYKGDFGEVRAGLQYSYTERELYSGTGGGGAAFVGDPRQNEHTVMTSLRYYPFQADPAPKAPVVARY